MSGPRNIADLTEPLAAFWRDFLAAQGRDAATPLTDVFYFSDNEADATELAALVLQGTKTGTASLVWMYEERGDRVPAPGDLSIVTDWHGSPLCVMETTRVDVLAFDDVGAAFAASEGEGDLSLAYWRRVHWDYFARECTSLGRTASGAMPVVCENFRVVYRKGDPA